MSEVSKCNSYHHGRIYDQSSDNILLRQVDFPLKVGKKDIVDSVWSDRIMSKWSEVIGRWNKNESFIGMVLSFSDEDFLKFIGELVGQKSLNGARLVKFVHAQSGFCVWRMDYYISTNPQRGYSDSYRAPNIISSKDDIPFILDEWDPFDDMLKL
jgi:hypothetical protein